MTVTSFFISVLLCFFPFLFAGVVFFAIFTLAALAAFASERQPQR